MIGSKTVSEKEKQKLPEIAELSEQQNVAKLQSPLHFMTVYAQDRDLRLKIRNTPKIKPLKPEVTNYDDRTVELNKLLRTDFRLNDSPSMDLNALKNRIQSNQ